MQLDPCFESQDGNGLNLAHFRKFFGGGLSATQCYAELLQDVAIRGCDLLAFSSQQARPNGAPSTPEISTALKQGPQK